VQGFELTHGIDSLDEKFAAEMRYTAYAGPLDTPICLREMVTFR
jgi:hypothetical protein